MHVLSKWLVAVIAVSLAGFLITPARAVEEPKPAAKPVSYYRQVRPVFQAQCQGCHQPAKAKGGYVMTEFARLLGTGDAGKIAIVPGQPAASHLVAQITPDKNGEAEMPKGKPALAVVERELIVRWITEGARDDTPANAVIAFDAAHPPVYTRPPVITSVDYSPDGKLLAIAGFNEVLLYHADGSGLVARLVGLSERIEKVAFSPDGKRLAVAGGKPARMGEIQIWDVEKRALLVSAPVGYDTVYGASWSPDGKLVAFGLPDNTVRAIEAASGKQVLQQGSHNDWVLDTVFTPNGSNLVSAGRDMSAKLTEVATQRFMDNVTSITPGALRGGIHAVAMHPARAEALVGGSDGVPQIFQVFRQAARKIGDNATLLRKFPALEGRIFSVDFAPDGKRIAACASLDGVGALNICAADYDPKIPTNILKAYEKTAGEYTAAERKAIEEFHQQGVKLISAMVVSNASLYALSFSPDGKTVAVAGSDGNVRLVDAANGNITKTFAVAPLSTNALAAAPVVAPAAATTAKVAEIKEQLPKNAEVTALEVLPAKLSFSRRNDYAQLLVTARLNTGDAADVTRLAKFSVTGADAEISPLGLLTPRADGAGEVKISFGGKEVSVPVEAKGFKAEYEADFVRDLNPILAKLGCNAGTCHGAKDGKNGFKLSLRGYDPIYDIRAFTDDLVARRVTVASPDDSLMALKATGAVPHEGGQRCATDSKYYAVLVQWIANGAKLNLNSPRVTRLQLFPQNPVVQEAGAKQQMRVLAIYADGAERDVTAEAFLETGNQDVAVTDAAGLVTTLRRGEAPMLARYEGNYAATTVTVMGDRSGFVWADQPANNKLDELVAAKWQRMRILPSELCSDTDFIRRLYLDLTGLPPTPDDVRGFLADTNSSKRNPLIAKLIGTPEYVDHWANKWADLLQVNRKFLGGEGAALFREWIRAEVAANTPYDEFARKILTARGSNKDNPAASYYKILRGPAETMENTTHLWLATRFNCNKCHDHPFERWTQDQYYQMSAFFAQFELRKDVKNSGNNVIGGTAVEGAKPLYEMVADRAEGEMTHDRTGKITPPDFPYPAKFTLTRTDASDVTRREKLAAWITSADNRYFAASYVNRLWGYLLGVGIIEPLDDIRAGNPPSNPELLDHLTREFIRSGFDTRHVIRLICESRAYQLALATHKWNEDDKINYSHATARRLPAETLLDAVFKVTGSTPDFPGVKPGLRAAALPDAAVDLPSGFLANLGRPVRESACECERNNDIRLGSVMSLLSGPAVSGAVNDPKNALVKLVASEADDARLVNEIFLRVLNRPASEKETAAALKLADRLDTDHAELTNALTAAEAAWVPVFAKKSAERAEAIAKSQGALDSFTREIAPKVAALEKERLEKIAAAKQAAAAYSPMLYAKFSEFLARHGAGPAPIPWTPVTVSSAQASGQTTLEPLADGSYIALGGNELTEYNLEFTTALTNLTGLRIEALTDDISPGFGPGRSTGNFVLSEIRLGVLDAKDGKPAMQKFDDARASFVQSGHDVKLAIDGKNEQGKRDGWAIRGGEGQPQWLNVKLAKLLALAAGAKLRVTLQHQFQANYSLGRFRLWVTAAPAPLEGGVPADIAALLAVPPAQREPAQDEALLDYYRGWDKATLKREQAIATARRPVPEDPKLAGLRAVIAKAEQPVPTDPALLQLRADTAASTRQFGNKRLTLAQDLSWALINSPSFLFNR